MRSVSQLAGLLAAILCLLAVPALADEPGPGGSKPPIPVTGEQVYTMVCQSCHMADGKGGVGAGAIPSLASNPKLKIAAYPIAMVVNGRGAMPWFSDTLNAKQTAEVLTYVRTHFGNAYATPVTDAEVALIPSASRTASH
jgi:mono/diheme cytochrome c family protein